MSTNLVMLNAGYGIGYLGPFALAGEMPTPRRLGAPAGPLSNARPTRRRGARDAHTAAPARRLGLRLGLARALGGRERGGGEGGGEGAGGGEGGGRGGRQSAGGLGGVPAEIVGGRV